MVCSPDGEVQCCSIFFIGGILLLTIHGEVVNPHLAVADRILSVDQNFVLRKRELEDGEDQLRFFFFGCMDFRYIDSVPRFGQMISSTGASNL